MIRNEKALKKSDIFDLLLLIEMEEFVDTFSTKK